jgi:hypothetical protein
MRRTIDVDFVARESLTPEIYVHAIRRTLAHCR